MVANQNDSDGERFETAIITDDEVLDQVAPSQEAKTWRHVEVKDDDHPTGGYWYPSRRAGDDIQIPGTPGVVYDPDELLGREILQFPLESREPELASGAVPPEGVKNRVVE